MHERGGTDQRVGHAQTCASERARSVGDATIDDQFIHAGEQSADGGVVSMVSCQQFGAGDHGVREPTTAR